MTEIGSSDLQKPREAMFYSSYPARTALGTAIVFFAVAVFLTWASGQAKTVAGRSTGESCAEYIERISPRMSGHQPLTPVEQWDSACDLTEKTGQYPWKGYALRRDRGSYEYFLNYAYQTHQDCIEITRKIAGVSGDYGEPIGCSYFSNSYWQVLLFTLLHPDKGLGCIYHSRNGREVKMEYRSALFS
jgi:hypothetical protein